MKITTVGIDLAKNVFQIHAVDERGQTALKKQFKRDQVAAFFANLPPCLIGMEACGSAHHWARKLEGFGHTVRLMAPQFVKPYVKLRATHTKPHSNVSSQPYRGVAAEGASAGCETMKVPNGCADATSVAALAR